MFINCNQEVENVNDLKEERRLSVNKMLQNTYLLRKHLNNCKDVKHLITVESVRNDKQLKKAVVINLIKQGKVQVDDEIRQILE